MKPQAVPPHDPVLHVLEDLIKTISSMTRWLEALEARLEELEAGQ